MREGGVEESVRKAIHVFMYMFEGNREIRINLSQHPPLLTTRGCYHQKRRQGEWGKRREMETPAGDEGRRTRAEGQ